MCQNNRKTQDDDIKAQFEKDFALLESITKEMPSQPAPTRPDQKGEMGVTRPLIKKSGYIQYMSEIEILQRMIYIDSHDYIMHIPMPLLRIMSPGAVLVFCLIFVQYGNQDAIVIEDGYEPSVTVDSDAWRGILNIDLQQVYKFIDIIVALNLISVRRLSNGRQAYTVNTKHLGNEFMRVKAEIQSLVMSEKQALESRKESSKSPQEKAIETGQPSQSEKKTKSKKSKKGD
jgi:hypothetical protein